MFKLILLVVLLPPEVLPPLPLVVLFFSQIAFRVKSLFMVLSKLNSSPSTSQLTKLYPSLLGLLGLFNFSPALTTTLSILDPPSVSKVTV